MLCSFLEFFLERVLRVGVTLRLLKLINRGGGGRELPSENGSVPFKTGELEHIFFENKEGSKSQMKRHKTSWVYQFDPIF